MKELDPMKYKLVEMMTTTILEDYLKQNRFSTKVSKKLKKILKWMKNENKDWKHLYKNIHSIHDPFYNKMTKRVIIDDVAFEYNTRFICYFKLRK